MNEVEAKRDLDTDGAKRDLGTNRKKREINKILYEYLPERYRKYKERGQ